MIKHTIHRCAATLALSLIMNAVLTGCGADKNKITGWASENEQKVSFTSGISWWDPAERRLTVAFMPYAPDGKEREEILKYRSLFLGMKKKTQYVELNLIFKPGATTADNSMLERYFIVFGNYAESPMTLNRQHHDWAQDGGILELSGSPDSQARGHFKREDSFRQTRYQWDLVFDVSPVRAQP
jgi:hypothetical protein